MSSIPACLLKLIAKELLKNTRDARIDIQFLMCHGLVFVPFTRRVLIELLCDNHDTDTQSVLGYYSAQYISSGHSCRNGKCLKIFSTTSKMATGDLLSSVLGYKGFENFQ